MTPMQIQTTDIPAHPALALLPDVPTREDIEDFGQLLQSLEGEDGHAVPDIKTAHHFAGDVYGRSVVIPAGTYLVGLPHKDDHLNICVGDIVVWTEQGKQRFSGPRGHILPAKAGVMRVGFALEDTTWLSVHVNRTGGQDTNAIEDALVEHPERLMTRRVPALEVA